jgi:hypothetical protein
VSKVFTYLLKLVESNNKTVLKVKVGLPMKWRAKGTEGGMEGMKK